MTRGDVFAAQPLRIAAGTASAFLEQSINYPDPISCLSWPFCRSNTGYAKITINKTSYTVHRLICERVHGSAPGPLYEAAHTCGRGADGCINPHHLAWKTRQENEDDKIVHGTRLRGEQIPWSKLTDTDVVKLRALWPSLTYEELGLLFGVSFGTVGRIVRREIWTHV